MVPGDVTARRACKREDLPVIGTIASDPMSSPTRYSTSAWEGGGIARAVRTRCCLAIPPREAVLPSVGKPGILLWLPLSLGQQSSLYSRPSHNRDTIQLRIVLDAAALDSFDQSLHTSRRSSILHEP